MAEETERITLINHYFPYLGNGTFPFLSSYAYLRSPYTYLRCLLFSANPLLQCSLGAWNADWINQSRRSCSLRTLSLKAQTQTKSDQALSFILVTKGLSVKVIEGEGILQPWRRGENLGARFMHRWGGEGSKPMQ